MAERELIAPGAPTPDFPVRAADATIEKVASAMRANNIETRVVDTGEDAARRVLELIPEGAEVHSTKSKTLRDIGLLEILVRWRTKSSPGNVPRFVGQGSLLQVGRHQPRCQVMLMNRPGFDGGFGPHEVALCRF